MLSLILAVEEIIFIVVMIVVGIPTTWLMVHMGRTRQRVEQAWRRVAAELHTLSVSKDDSGWPILGGTYRGRAIRAEFVSRGTAGHKSAHTRVSSSYTAALPHEFALEPRGWLLALQTAFGKQDVKIGDEAFDREFVVQGADPRAVRALLSDANIRAHILEQAKSEPALTVSHGQVVIENNGMITKSAALRSMLEAVTCTAEALDAAAAGQG